MREVIPSMTAWDRRACLLDSLSAAACVVASHASSVVLAMSRIPNAIARTPAARCRLYRSFSWYVSVGLRAVMGSPSM